MTVTEYLKVHDMSINALSRETGIAYTTLHPHVKHGAELSLKTAKRLESWSKGEMTAADILNLSSPAAPAA